MKNDEQKKTEPEAAEKNCRASQEETAARLLAVPAHAISSAVFAAAVFIPALLFSLKSNSGSVPAAYTVLWCLFAGMICFFMAFRDRISVLRLVFFAASSAAFLLHFKFYALRAFPGTDAPPCHIAMAGSFLNYIYQLYLSFKSPVPSIWGQLSLGFLWLFCTLAAGRAWCSWICFYGGIDDFFCSAVPRKLLDIDSFAVKFRPVSAAGLFGIMLFSFAYMLPQYCIWLCPFKIGENFYSAASAEKILQHSFAAAAILCATLLPLLTKKRIFCSFLCPFGAWQAFWGHINPFRFSVDKNKCVSCGKCLSLCPHGAAFLKDGTAHISAWCAMCGRCAEACPAGAIKCTVYGMSVQEKFTAFARLVSVKYVFIFCSMLLGTVFSSLWAPAALHELFSYIF